MTYTSDWDEKYKDAIAWIQSLYNKSYTMEQVKAISDLIRYEIPPLRLMKVAQFACREAKRHSLPLANDLLDANSRCPYSDMSVQKTESCNCYKGIIFFHYVNMRRWMKHENQLSKEFTENAYGWCECHLGRKQMNAHPNDKLSLKKYLENCGIEWSGIINPADYSIRSAKYPGRILRLTYSETKPHIREINADNWLPNEVAYRDDGLYETKSALATAAEHLQSEPEQDFEF